MLCVHWIVFIHISEPPGHTLHGKSLPAGGSTQVLLVPQGEPGGGCRLRLDAVRQSGFRSETLYQQLFYVGVWPLYRIFQ